MDCRETAGRHLVVVGAAVCKPRLFGGSWTVGVHPSTPHSLSHVTVVVVQPNTSFVHLQFLVQINIWTWGIVALSEHGAMLASNNWQERETGKFGLKSLNMTHQ